MNTELTYTAYLEEDDSIRLVRNADIAVTVDLTEEPATAKLVKGLLAELIKHNQLFGLSHTFTSAESQAIESSLSAVETRTRWMKAVGVNSATADKMRAMPVAKRPRSFAHFRHHLA